jgi:ATP-dependent exoDNAse (exonuclease V) alpha subunit
MIAERLDLAKAPFMGDRQQLSAIEQGKMFAVSQAAGQATVRMDENIRQRLAAPARGGRPVERRPCRARA